MPPAVPIAQVIGVAGAPTTIRTFATPAARKAGDTYLAIVATGGAQTLDVANSSGWEQLAALQTANGTVIVARRIAADTDGPSLQIQVSAVPTFVRSVLLVYRALDPDAVIVGATASAITASVNFVCPTQALARYSDLYLGIVAVSSATVAVTPPAGTTERYDATGGLEVFELLAEAAGLTGTKTATTAVAQTGIAASIALATYPPASGLSFTFDPIGAIGLPTVGV